MAANATTAIPTRLRKWLALIVLLTASFLSVFDFNVVNLALPTLRESLGASNAGAQFVISIYGAAYAVFLITGGRLGDLYGRRRMFILGIAGFTIASIGCGLSTSAEVLIAVRAVQGSAAALMAPQVLASIRVMFATPEQPRALGLYGATFGMGAVLGQLFGGILVSAHPFGLPWQAIFFVNVPIGIAALIAAAPLIPESRSAGAQRIDIMGMALLSLGLAMFVYPLIEGREAGWPAWVITVFLLALVVFAAFGRFEAHLAARGGAPLIQPALFKNARFVVGLVLSLTFYMISSFYLTFSVYLQEGRHDTPLSAALAIMPFTLGFFVSSLTSSSVMKRLGLHGVTLGFVVQAIGFALVAAAIARPGPFLDSALFIAGIGYGTVLPSIINVALTGIDTKLAGVASGAIVTAFQIGSSLGVATIGTLFYAVLGHAPASTDYARAFDIGLSCNVALFIVDAALIEIARRAWQNRAST